MSILPLALVLLAAPPLAPPSAPPSAPHSAATPAWTLQVDPLTTALGFVHLQVERRLAPHWSVYAGPHLRLFSAPGAEAEDFTGYGAEVGVRYFFRPTAPAGWWALVRGVGAHLQADEDTAVGGYVSALGGYTWISSGGFVLSGGAGAQYLHYRVAGLGPKMFFVALHTALGFAF